MIVRQINLQHNLLYMRSYTSGIQCI